MISRRRFLAGLAGLGLGGVGLEAIFLEPRRVSVTHHRLGSPRTRDQQPLRLIQLTDLHLRSLTSFHEEIAAVVGQAAPDVVVLTGDSLDRPAGLGLLRSFLALLPTGPDRLATLGNWEYWSGVDLAELRRLYDRASCRLLVNETARVRRAGGTADFVGLDDLVGGSPNLAKAVGSVGLGDDAVILSHCPAYRDEALDLESIRPVGMLSGHTHGGQVALGEWAPLRPQGSGPYRAGWYRGSPVDLYVSRGLGTSRLPVRLGSVPEVAIFDWYLESASGPP